MNEPTQTQVNATNSCYCGQLHDFLLVALLAETQQDFADPIETSMEMIC